MVFEEGTTVGPVCFSAVLGLDGFDCNGSPLATTPSPDEPGRGSVGALLDPTLTDGGVGLLRVNGRGVTFGSAAGDGALSDADRWMAVVADGRCGGCTMLSGDTSNRGAEDDA